MNANMKDLFNLFADPTRNPMNHFSVTLCNELGIILTIDKFLTSLILLHNMESLPATHQNKKLVVCGLIVPSSSSSLSSPSTSSLLGVGVSPSIDEMLTGHLWRSKAQFLRRLYVFSTVLCPAR
jgi:hypothetical protein